MPSGQPFTKLCQALARPKYHGRVDLHLHTTYSDGTYTPAEVVDLAQRSGLAAIAVTDHDTLAGIAPTQRAAGSALEVITGVEITAELCGRELHLLGYYFDVNNAELRRALEGLRAQRVGRFHAMVDRLHGLGVHIDAARIAKLGSATTLGRRHLAELLVQSRHAASVREAFRRYLGDQGRATVAKARLPVAQAIALVREAGGVAAWAHPPQEGCLETLRELRRLGLGAVEAEYPSFRTNRIKELRGWARELGLAITGGSDCHGPGEPHRAIGASGITHAELQALKEIRTVHV